jgi:predicted XRE-type DNA-binding protein
VKIDVLKANNHKRAFEVTAGDEVFEFPYAKCDHPPSSEDPIAELYIDDELGREGFTFTLASGIEDSVMMDWVLDVNEDPAYMRDLLLFNLTAKALDIIESEQLAKREIARRLGTSPTQLYRLLDTTNYQKSVDAMLDLLHVLGLEIDVTVRPRRGGSVRREDVTVCAEDDPIGYATGAKSPGP